ncbi:unnamed protein product, partial [Phaeothamnion confervicola]
MRHELFNIYFLFSKWFTRPQRVCYFMTSVLTLMAIDAAVSSVVYEDYSPCLSYATRAACLANGKSLQIYDSGQTTSGVCEWHSRTGSCYHQQVPINLEWNVAISTVALIFRVPVDILMLYVFARFVARPVGRGNGGGGRAANEKSRIWAHDGDEADTTSDWRAAVAATTFVTPIASPRKTDAVAAAAASAVGAVTPQRMVTVGHV